MAKFGLSMGGMFTLCEVQVILNGFFSVVFQVVCGSCSENTAPLAYLNYTQARVCDKCYDVLLKG